MNKLVRLVREEFHTVEAREQSIRDWKRKAKEDGNLVTFELQDSRDGMYVLVTHVRV